MTILIQKKIAVLRSQHCNLFFTFCLFSWFSVESVGVSCTKENYFQYNFIKKRFKLIFLLSSSSKTHNLYIDTLSTILKKRVFLIFSSVWSWKNVSFSLVNKDKIPSQLNWNRQGLLNWNISVGLHILFAFFRLKKN